MNSVMISADEFESRRFARLCHELNVDTPGGRWQTFGHLIGWTLHWAKTIELDSGLWFDSSLCEVGGWTGFSGEEAPRWGSALHKAGYIGTMKETYPAPLGTRRKGWVALTADGGVMLNISINLFKKRPDAAMLCLYVLDRTKRIAFAKGIGIDADAIEQAEMVPQGWLKSEPGQDPQYGHQSQSTVAMLPRQPVVGFGAQPAQQGAQGMRTANPKSSVMLETVRKNKYDNPKLALMALDSTAKAANNWNKAVSRDPGAVSQVLAEMVETDSAWAQIHNPASLATARLKSLGLVN